MSLSGSDKTSEHESPGVQSEFWVHISIGDVAFTALPLTVSAMLGTGTAMAVEKHCLIPKVNFRSSGSRKPMIFCALISIMQPFAP